MIEAIAILQRKDGEETRHGTIAKDSTGSIAMYSDKNLVSAMQAMFRETKSLFRTTRKGDSLIKQEITVTDPQWILELRRQLPSPFYGGSVETSNMNLDSIPSQYVACENEKSEEYLFERLG